MKVKYSISFLVALIVLLSATNHLLAQNPVVSQAVNFKVSVPVRDLLAMKPNKKDLKEKDIELNAAPATRLHMLNFLDAIDNGTRPVADIEEAHISTASCILANLSMQLKRPLSYDPVKREIPGDPEATKLLQRSYRQSWIHPQPGTV